MRFCFLGAFLCFGGYALSSPVPIRYTPRARSEGCKPFSRKIVVNRGGGLVFLRQNSENPENEKKGAISVAAD